VNLRLPELMLEELKALANKRDIPYQSLMKMFLAERIEHELKSRVIASKFWTFKNQIVT